MAEPAQSEDQSPPSAALGTALRNTHRAVLALIAVCLLVSLTAEAPADEPPPDRTLTLIALCVAAMAIVLRRLSTSPVLSPRTGLFLSLGALLACAGVALAGAYAAVSLAATQTGVAFSLAGGIFALRRPEVLRRLQAR